MDGIWAEVTREMLLARDFFHPTINGNPYFDKPLLTYWLIVICSYFAGGVDEWSTRLPRENNGVRSTYLTDNLSKQDELLSRVAFYMQPSPVGNKTPPYNDRGSKPTF